MHLDNYVISVVVMSAILGFTSYAAYPGSASGATKFAASVLLLYVAVMPIGAIFTSIRDGTFDSLDALPEMPQIEENGEYLEAAEEAFREGISKLLFTKYGINPENATVKTEGFDFRNMRCERILITLRGSGTLADFRGIEEYISESGLGECEVSASFG